MKEYEDLKLFEFPIQNRIENMPVGALYMARLADGFYNVYLKISDSYSYFLKSNRKTFGKFETMTPSWFRTAWEKPYNKNNVLFSEFVPYYRKSMSSNTYELGYMKEETIRLWILKTKMVSNISESDVSSLKETNPLW